MPGRAIRLQWTREDEFRYEPYGSAMLLRVAAGAAVATEEPPNLNTREFNVFKFQAKVEDCSQCGGYYNVI